MRIVTLILCGVAATACTQQLAPVVMKGDQVYSRGNEGGAYSTASRSSQYNNGYTYPSEPAVQAAPSGGVGVSELPPPVASSDLPPLSNSRSVPRSNGSTTGSLLAPLPQKRV